MDLTNLEFLADGFNSLLDNLGAKITVRNNKVDEVGNFAEAFDLDKFHTQSLQWHYNHKDRIFGEVTLMSHDPLTKENKEARKEITVYIWADVKFALKVDQNTKVKHVMKAAEVLYKTDMRCFRLCLDGRRINMEKEKTLIGDLQMENNDVIYMFKTMCGGGGGGLKESSILMSLDANILDPKFNYDFTKKKASREFKRGGAPYKRPYGWNRLALNVRSRYGDMDWLGGAGGTRRTESVEGEWPVSYHGTEKGFAEEIAEQGYRLDKSKRFMFGKGIYSTTDPDIAEKYAKV